MRARSWIPSKTRTYIDMKSRDDRFTIAIPAARYRTIIYIYIISFAYRPRRRYCWTRTIIIMIKVLGPGIGVFVGDATAYDLHFPARGDDTKVFAGLSS